MKTAINFKAVVVIVLCAILLPEGAWAANRTKADNNDDLTNGTSWVEGTAPGTSDTAIWDATVATPANCTNTSSATFSVKGVVVTDPAANVKITTTVAMTIGTDGIVLNGTRDFYLSQGGNGIFNFPNVASVWDIAPGRTVTIDSIKQYLWTGSGSGTWSLKGGGTVVFTNGTTAAFGVGGNNPCSLEIENGTLRLCNGFSLGGTGTGAVYQTGGSVETPVSGGYGLSLGNAHNAVSVYDLSGGTLIVSTNAALGSWDGTSGGFKTNMNSTLIVRDAGVATITNDIWMGGVKCKDGVATVTLRTGGTLSVGSIMVNSAVVNYTSIVEFDGGTLKPMRDKTTFLGGLTQATLSTNGAVIDTANCSITISQKLENATSQAGKLVKTGPGVLTLVGTNTYTGATSVNNGKLVINNNVTISNSAAINVASGATCDVSAVSGFVVYSNQSLMGLGVVTGRTTMAAGATLAPDGTNGTLLVTGSASATNLVLGGTLSVTGDVSRVSTTPWLSVTGSVDLASSTITGVNLNLLTKPQSYILLSYSGTRVGSFNSTPPASGWRVSYDDAHKQVLLLGATPGLIIRVQ